MPGCSVALVNAVTHNPFWTVTADGATLLTGVPAQGKTAADVEAALRAEVARVASGYVYYVSLKGVTGAGTLDTAAVEAMLPRIRQHVHIPVGVGFGIRDAASAQAVGRVADAVVIGSKIIQLIEDQPHEKVTPVAVDFLRGIRRALDA